LYKELATTELLNNPSFDEGCLWVTKPDISFPREVVLAFYAFDNIYAAPEIFSLKIGRGESARKRSSALGHVSMMPRAIASGRREDHAMGTVTLCPPVGGRRLRGW